MMRLTRIAGAVRVRLARRTDLCIHHPWAFLDSVRRQVTKRSTTTPSAAETTSHVWPRYASPK